MRASIAYMLIAIIGLTACGGSQEVNPDPRGILRFKGEPSSAHIEIDDQSLGPLHMFEQDGVLLRPGDHRIVARAGGFFPEYLVVEIRAGETKVVELSLRPIPD